ncbi:MAG: sialate O-acetylesterase [Sphingomonadales bacterium]|nr:MAG: sialate O-acetylesterase [Sphingomonadales bacterium]TNF05987.1 MAG: sialate O-acetylesterase [Sphingomonadales bacterium]
MSYSVPFALVLLASSTSALATPIVSPYWTDHAVIQRGKAIMVEGEARPGERVSGTLGDEGVQAVADGDGHFTLGFQPREAGGPPLTLTVGDRQVRDLLVGDVWLCSGQSNMAFMVEQGLNAGAEIAASADDGLRLLRVPDGSAVRPQTGFSEPAQWTPAAPDTVRHFSAACYFMARDLRESLRVPVGVINSSYGGSQIRVWLTPESGKALYGQAQMDMLRSFGSDELGTVARFAPTWEEWYREHSGGSTPWLTPDALHWDAVPQISVWNAWPGSPLVDSPIGTVWLRREVNLTPAQAKAGGLLSLGIIDEIDMSWVNGHPVGNSFGWDVERKYAIPSRFLKAGRNEIIVAATNSWGTGGFASSPEKLNFTPSGEAPIALADGWRYSKAPMTAFPPRSPWDTNAGIGVRHNAMVAPLGHVALKGAAWYQGESDVDLPGYRDRMRELFAGWRKQFSPDMRMLVVQLANYGPVQLAPGPSGWADLREDQRQAVLADKNAALVTAIDIGERIDIHPANKQVLGHRLALAAQGQALPQPVAAMHENGGIRIRFAGVDEKLIAWSGAGPLAFELCGAEQASCRYAEARMDGATVLLADDGKPATRIRYGWADSPVVNAYDRRAMPLPGFELPIADR